LNNFFLLEVNDNSGLEQIWFQNKGIVYSLSTFWALDDIKGTHARDFMVRFSQFFGIIQ
jgi:hypothetical protein